MHFLVNVLAVSASALVSAGRAVHVHANNIVNAQTSDFMLQAPVYSPIVSGGALFTQNMNERSNMIAETLGLMSVAQQYRASAFLRTFT